MERDSTGAPERYYTPGQISELYGGTYPAAQIRAACRRGGEFHPLPHVEIGAKRPVFKIRPSTFARWLDEEEMLCAGKRKLRR